jgi:hypothetical protein
MQASTLTFLFVSNKCLRWRLPVYWAKFLPMLRRKDEDGFSQSSSPFTLSEYYLLGFYTHVVSQKLTNVLEKTYCIFGVEE